MSIADAFSESFVKAGVDGVCLGQVEGLFGFELRLSGKFIVAAARAVQ